MTASCNAGQHDWNGCRCKHCGQTRDEGHSFDVDTSRCDDCPQRVTGVDNQSFSCLAPVEGTGYCDKVMGQCRLCGKAPPSL